MTQLTRFGHLFSPYSIHFIQPYWKKEQWKICLGILHRETYRQAPRLLERKIAEMDGARYCRSFNLGRSAIQVSLEAFRFPAGTEVILPSFSCAGVITPVIYAGLQPVLVDIDDHFNIEVNSVSQALSPKTRAIILPHLSGKPARDFLKILDIAAENNLKVIVDATQAIGLKLGGSPVSSYGDACVYSFNGGKLIPGSGGGLLVSGSGEIITHIESIAVPVPLDSSGNERIMGYILKHGLHKITHPVYRIVEAIDHRLNGKRKQNQERNKDHSYPIEDMDAIESALALSQLKFLPEIIDKRRLNSERLIASGVLQDLGFRVPDSRDHLFTKFLVTHGDERVSFLARKVLYDYGIETEQSYTPLHLREVGRTARKVDTPNTDRSWKGAFAIPVNPRLGSQDMDRIIQTLKKRP